MYDSAYLPIQSCGYGRGRRGHRHGQRHTDTVQCDTWVVLLLNGYQDFKGKRVCKSANNVTVLLRTSGWQIPPALSSSWSGLFLFPIRSPIL